MLVVLRSAGGGGGGVETEKAFHMTGIHVDLFWKQMFRVKYLQ